MSAPKRARVGATLDDVCVERARARGDGAARAPAATLPAAERAAILVRMYYGGAPLQPRRAQSAIKDLERFSCTLYLCHKCGKRQTMYQMAQTRSADEGMTQIIVCICGHHWKA